MLISVITRTPQDYDDKTSLKMQNAGLVRIEIDFEHDENFTRGYFIGTRYIFESCIITCPKKFRKKVYNYE